MEVGFYGKLPTHGDFLRRRVDEEFVQTWDRWLQECIAASRRSLGERWMDLYLTAPVWRFALAAGVCGEQATAGLMVPSVDRVGRYFPVALVWPVPYHLPPLAAALKFQTLFDKAETLLLDALAAEQLEFAEFDRRVQELPGTMDAGESAPGVTLDSDAAAAILDRSGPGYRLSIARASELQVPALALCGHWLQSLGQHALFWTDGSAAVEPSWLLTPGLPTAAQYSAMLDGDWHAGGWSGEGTMVDPAQTLVRAEWHAEPDPPAVIEVVRSAGYSDAGPVRAENQDAFLERPDLRIWAVADGLGGLDQGAVASRIVCDALVDAPTAADLDEAIEGVSGRLADVNTYLRRQANHPVKPLHSGSTVVALLMRGEAAAVLWAGDSRAYRLRDGVLAQLTVDHSWQGGDDPQQETAITRAVGGEDDFSVDAARCELRPGDRFLLCSDGLYRVLGDAILTTALGTGEPAMCCKELVKRALSNGTTDNVTAVVVEYGRAAASLTDVLSIVSVEHQAGLDSP